MDASVRAVVVMAAIFALSQLGALVLVSTSLGEDYQAFEDPNDPMIPVYYIIAIVVFTFVVLYVIKKKRERVIKYVFVGAVGFTIFYVLLIMALQFDTGILSLLVSVALSAVLIYFLLKRPEWYVIDATGVLVSVGVIGIMGISLNILPVLILLAVLAVYDAVSVYGTKHMVALADGVTEMKLPILLVIPKKSGYSYLDQKSLKKQLEDGDEREAMFMGLGDVIIPGILVASAFYYLSDEAVMGLPGNLLVATGALIGGLVGFALLMGFVLKGNPQAGLPLLNGGTVAGYIVAYLLVFQELSLGISLPW